MRFSLAKEEIIEFSKEYPRGVMGKIGNVAMRYQCSEDSVGYSKRLSDALEKMLSSSCHGLGYIQVGIILKEPESMYQAILQLVEEDSSFLNDVIALPGVENVKVKVTLSEFRESSWPNVDNLAPTVMAVSKEMNVNDEFEKNCEDTAVQFTDESWYEMFKTRAETVSARISIDAIISSNLNLEKTPKSFLTDMYERLLYDRSHCDAVIVAKDGTEVKCHKAVLSACSPKISAMLSSKEEDEELKVAKVEMREMSEEVVQSLLEFIYFQGEEEPNKDSEMALSLLMAAVKYEDIPSLETSMKNILLSKPANWYDMDVAFRLFVFARDSKQDELKMKAVQVLKQHSASFQESGAKLFKDNPEAALELCHLAFSS